MRRGAIIALYAREALDVFPYNDVKICAMRKRVCVCVGVMNFGLLGIRCNISANFAGEILK